MFFKWHTVHDTQRLVTANLVQVDIPQTGLWISNRDRWCVWQFIRSEWTAYQWRELNVWIQWRTVMQIHLDLLQDTHDAVCQGVQAMTSDILGCFSEDRRCRRSKRVWSRIHSGLHRCWNLYWFASASPVSDRVIMGLSIRRNSAWHTSLTNAVKTSRFWILLQIGASALQYRWSRTQLTGTEARLSDSCNIRTSPSINYETSWFSAFHVACIFFTVFQASSVAACFLEFRLLFYAEQVNEPFKTVLDELLQRASLVTFIITFVSRTSDILHAN